MFIRICAVCKFNFFSFVEALSVKVRTVAFMRNTVELQWLENGWLVYHSCFELVFEPIAAGLR